MREKVPKNAKLLDAIFSTLIILLPFLYQYKGIGNIISFGEVLLIIVISLIILREHKLKLIGYDKKLLLFYLVSLVTTLLCAFFPYFNIEAAFTVILRLFFYALVIYIGRKHFDLSIVFNFYVDLTFIFSTYLILQYLYHYLLGGYLPIYVSYNLLFPPEARAASLTAYYRFGFRASSLFLESSYYSLFALPVTSMLVFLKKTRFQVLELVVICAALVLSTANSALVGLVIVFGIFMFVKISERKNRKTLYQILVVVLALGMILAYFYFSDNTAYFFKRVTSGGSFNQRIVRGILVYSGFPLFNKIFGVGLNNLEPYMKFNHIQTIYDEVNLNYSCSLVQTLDYSGIIGIVSLIIYFIFLRRKVNNASHFSLWMLIVFIASYESIMFTYRFTFLILLFEGLIKENSKKTQFKGKFYDYSS